MDAVTGLSGSGPAYIFLIVTALADAGVKMGLSRQEALFLSSQTILGSARLLLETHEHPGKLRDRVTSPGGTAIAGIHTLEEGGLRTTLMNAVEVATLRSKELGQAMIKKRRPTRIARVVACALGPALLVAILRWVAFDRAAPLAVLAKPSDLEHGINYALRALVWTGPPLLLVAPRAVASIGGRHQMILAAFGAHTVAVALAGGDWMALFRLFVPVLPGVLLVGGAIAERTPSWSTLARCGVALAACGGTQVEGHAKSICVEICKVSCSI